mmetsp:Transcript_24049/g.33789  ORF Transcript_24049/g.33789 Transcript_24049/m.33789 type:complete len:253 (-) Transcript_24049:166-924(-)
MTIVASEDTRNSEWTKSNKGLSLLSKMGWTEGQGLGKRKQGTAHALRAVRRLDDSLGIGASGSDITGSQGWDTNVDNFASVLSNLQSQHGSGTENAAATETSKEESSSFSKKKKSKKDKKRKSSKKSNNELVLARNKVNAGHARKMRAAKDLNDKSEHDLAAIFGTKLPSNSSSRSQSPVPPPSLTTTTGTRSTDLVESKKQKKQKRQRSDDDEKEDSAVKVTTDKKKEKKKNKKSKKDKKKQKVASSSDED